MINNLTLTQEKQLIEFRNECLKIGLSTEPIKRERREHQEIVDYIYKEYFALPAPIIWYVDGPLMFNLLINFIFNFIFRDLKEQNLGENLWQNFWQPLEQTLEQTLGSSLKSSLEQNLWQPLKQNLEQNLWENLRQDLEQSLKQNLKQFENIYWGNVDVYWLSSFIFPQKYLGISYTDSQTTSLNYLYQLSQKIGWIWYFKNICFISDRPIEIHKKGILLHNETKPAILFRDGYAIWCLNGINVPREIVETPAEQLNPHILLKEQNIEIRREIVRKIGIERVCQELNAKILDKKDNYELLNLNLRQNRMRPYLKMKNPSTGTYHIEGVHPNCKTIEQALNWRNQTKEEPEVLT